MPSEKIDKPYFVMLRHPLIGTYVPLDCGEHEFELSRFETEKDAREAAKSSDLGSSFGFEVFNMGNGE